VRSWAGDGLDGRVLAIIDYGEAREGGGELGVVHSDHGPGRGAESAGGAAAVGEAVSCRSVVAARLGDDNIVRAESTDEFDEYEVVINGEEQYSIWPADREVPAGWKALGVRGSKDDCLRRIDELWIDMRPRSLRDAMHEGDH
jgi:MbtH protein